jgi:hypothetical protein
MEAKMAKSYADMTDKELFTAMRGEPASSFTYIEMDAELKRRVADNQLAAGEAQIRSSRYQLAVVIAMFLTILVTIWMGRH